MKCNYQQQHHRHFIVYITNTPLSPFGSRRNGLVVITVSQKKIMIMLTFNACAHLHLHVQCIFSSAFTWRFECVYDVLKIWWKRKSKEISVREMVRRTWRKQKISCTNSRKKGNINQSSPFFETLPFYLFDTLWFGK